MSMMYTEIKITWKVACEFLIEQAMEIVNSKKKKVNLITKNSRNHMDWEKSVIFDRTNVRINILKIKIWQS